jgi:hypothetical protein
LPNPIFLRKHWSHNAWIQIRVLPKNEIKKLLDKDPNWTFLYTKDAAHVYKNVKIKPPYDHITIHHHPGARVRFNDESLLKDFLDHVCWTENWLRSMRAIK